MKKTLFILMILLLGSLLLAQSGGDGFSKAWIVKDRDFGREFLRAYIDALMEMDPMADLEIQETDEMRVMVIVRTDGTIDLSSVYATSRGGALNKLDSEIFPSMKPELIEKLKRRKYGWDAVEQTAVGEVTGEIVNVFKERNYKQCRDAFWWTHRRVDISVLHRLFLRINPKFALAMEFGRSEIGFPTAASQTMNFGLATEIFKFFMTMPSGYPMIPSSSNPLEGSYGAGLKFDTPKFGGSISFQDMTWRNESAELSFVDKENIVYNAASGQIYYSFTNRIGSAEDEPGFIPLGSLRLQFGLSYSQFIYGYADSTEDVLNHFREIERTAPLELLQGVIRAEYTSDMNERYFNKWKLASQLNIGFTGFGSLQFYLSRTIMEWFGVNLETCFFWKGLEFDTESNIYYPDNEKDPFLWEPGWFITPSISIYF